MFILSGEYTGEYKSVYVRNLPSTVTATEIEQEFKNFGRIKPDGVFIRNRKVISFSSLLDYLWYITLKKLN